MENKNFDWENYKCGEEETEFITLEIPEGVTEIEDEAYFDRWDIGKVILPSTLKKIGKSAFGECVNLKEINFPESLEEIGECAFSHCDSLDVSIPRNIRYGEKAFNRHIMEKEALNEQLFLFINSPDIQKYLMRENYKFNTLQAIWLVWQSSHASLGEQFDAWDRILELMPDCPFECYGERCESIFERLKAYMEFERAAISRFFAQDGTYTARVHAKNARNFKPLYVSTRNVFDMMSALATEEIIKTLSEENVSEWEESLCSCLDGWDFYKKQNRHFLNNRYDRIIIQKNIDHSMIELELNRIGQVRLGSENFIEFYPAELWLDHCFKDRSFLDDNNCNFPLPFKKGELVCSVYRKKSLFRRPFVFDKTDENHVVWGYEGNLRHGIWRDTWDFSPMDIEYCLPPYNKHEERLHLLGQYLRGEISIVKYTNELLGYETREEDEE